MGSAGPLAACCWPRNGRIAAPDSGAERRICALGDQSALLGHLSPVEARLALTRLRLQRLSQGATPPRLTQLTTAGSQDNLDLPWALRLAQTAVLGRTATQGELLLRQWWWGGVAHP